MWVGGWVGRGWPGHQTSPPPPLGSLGTGLLLLLSSSVHPLAAATLCPLPQSQQAMLEKDQLVERLQGDLAETNQANANKADQIAELNAELQDSKVSLGHRAAEISRLQQELEAVRQETGWQMEEMLTLKQGKTQLQALASGLQQELSLTSNKLKEAQQQMSELQARARELGTLQEDVAERNATVQQLQAKLQQQVLGFSLTLDTPFDPLLHVQPPAH